MSELPVPEYTKRDLPQLDLMAAETGTYTKWMRSAKRREIELTPDPDIVIIDAEG